MSAFLGGGGGGSGAVSSVFGRTGAVVAVTGDYAVAQITGAAPLASPTFTGTVTMPDSSTWTTSGIGSLAALGVGETVPSAGQIYASGLIRTASAGSSSAPSLAIGNATTGLYSVSTTGLGFSVNGSLIFDYGITTGNAFTFAGTSVAVTNTFLTSIVQGNASLTLRSGSATGTVTLNTASTGTAANVGLLSITGGNNSLASGSNNAGSVNITGGNASGAGSTGNGGSITLTPGTSVGGTPGSVVVAGSTPTFSGLTTGGLAAISTSGVASVPALAASTLPANAVFNFRVPISFAGTTYYVPAASVAW